MIKVKITLQTETKQKRLNIDFESIDEFNKYKKQRLETGCKFIKYSIKQEGRLMYSESVFEYGISRDKAKQRSLSHNDNIVQRNSRNNNIALAGNKLINLNMTPARQRKLVKWFESEAPITTREINIIKSMFSCSKISTRQYNLIENIKLDVSRRKKVLY
jgi:hypothetical protein